MSLQLSFLGPFEVTLDGQPITRFATDRVRALLAYLAVEAERPHRREALAAMLWPDQPDAMARQNFRQTLSRLRRSIKERGATPTCLLITTKTLQFNTAAATLDVLTFQNILAQCDHHDHMSLERCLPCIQKLRQAVALYRGEFLQGFFLDNSQPFEEWALFKQEQLHRQCLDALHTLAAYHENRGEYDQVRAYAERQLALEPWQEAAHRQLMQALSLSGRRNEALAQYERCCRTLEEHLGIGPSPHTTALYEQIASGEWQPAAPPPSLPISTLPVQFTPFIGREKELGHIKERLVNADCRLLTLVGPGGIGKTRLSIEAASQLAAERLLFDDGIYFVALAPVTAVASLAPTIAAALNVTFHEKTPLKEQLLEYLRSKIILLLLDNFEHLVDGAELLLDILTAAPGVKFLVTSREPLHLQAEWLVSLDGLSYPETIPEAAQLAEPTKLFAYSAVELFRQRAARAKADFAPRPDEYMALVRICQLVQGVPLALEMAAVWVRQYSLEAIVEEIERSLDFLVTPLRDMPARHRSLRAVFDGSWDLLTPDEQHALAQTAIFRGSFSLEAGQVVTEANPSHFISLVNKSLLRQTETERYEVHELVRQFAAEKLESLAGLMAPAQNRHSAYYLGFVADCEAQLGGPNSSELLAGIRGEIDNIRQAWRQAVHTANREMIGRSLAGLIDFYMLSGLLQEGKGVLETAAAHVGSLLEKITPEGAAEPSEEDQLLYGRLLAGQAVFDNALGHYQQAILAARKALEIAQVNQNSYLEAVARLRWGVALWYQGDLEAAQPLIEQTLALVEAMPPEATTAVNRTIKADTLRALGSVALRLGAYSQAQSYYNQFLEMARRAGNRQNESQALRSLGVVARNLGDYEAAQRHLEHSLRRGRAIGDQRAEIGVLNTLGDIARDQGDYSKGGDYFEQVVRISREIGDRRSESIGMTNLGIVARDQGAYDEAKGYFEQALRLKQAIGFRRGEGWALACLGLLFHQLNDPINGRDYSQQALHIFLELGDRIGHGFGLTHLGHNLTGMGCFAEAIDAYRQAVALRQASKQPHLAVESLAGLARAQLGSGNLGQAQRAVDEILTFLASNRVDGTEEPLRIYLTCYKVLSASEDGRAAEALNRASKLLQERSDKIKDGPSRESFLTNVTVHREILSFLKSIHET